MTLSESIARGTQRLQAAQLSCADPLLHMKQIAMAALACDAARLLLRWEDPLTVDDEAKIEAILARRVTGEPLQYIFGYEWFWDSQFAVGPGCLIPRRETEVLIESVLAEFGASSAKKIVELGPGTGNIGLTLLQERPHWQWHAFELNPETLPYLERNRATLLLPEVRERYQIHSGDFFAGVGKVGRCDAIVTNPPYVAREVMPDLSREVQAEPPLALDGGAAGLEILKQLVSVACDILAPGGVFFSEIGSDQGKAMRDLILAHGFARAEIRPDYSGLDRIAIGWLRY